MELLKDPQVGVCHYPEHWPESQMREDFGRMAAAGFGVVRLAEGAWGYFEPWEGEFRFDLFDRALDECGRAGLKVVMGTPTYCGPAWIAERYPEVLRWDFRREPMRHGSRRHFNYTSPKYLELSDRICTALAERYKGHPAVVAWQLDNEFNCHMDVSYAPSDTAAFRVWLRERYGTIEAFNEAWGTRFWSQQYDDWGQVDLPGPTPAPKNPSAALDEVRFISDCVVRFAARQAKILRNANPKWEITHNHLFDNIDGAALRRPLDFYSHDHYPLFGDNDAMNAAFYLTTARAMGEPFGIMEHQAGPGGQSSYLLRSFRPGELKLASWQSVAHGARWLLYFNWRTCPFGAEQYWYGLLDADGRDTARLAEASEFARELRTSAAVLRDKRHVKRVGVLRCFESETNERMVDTFVKGGAKEWERFTRVLLRRGVPVNCVHLGDESEDWGAYKVLIAPHLCVVSPATAQRLRRYVEGGGALLLTARSGSKDVNNHVVMTPAPGLLTELVGGTVDAFSSLSPQIWSDKHTPVPAEVGGRTCEMGWYAEVLAAWEGTEVVGRYVGTDGLFGTSPCALSRRTGGGRTVYVGGYLGDAAIGVVLDHVLEVAGVGPTLAGLAEGVEAVDLGSHLVLLNHTVGEQTVRVGGRPVVLKARGVEIVAR